MEQVKRSRILLISPGNAVLVGKRTKKFHRRFPPLSLLISASLLRERGWQVELIDLNADPHADPLRTVARAQAADLVVLDTNPYADWQCPSYAIQHILDFATQLPGDRLILVGNHGTHYPGSLLERTGARVVIRQEPEATLLETAETLRAAGDLASVAGISFRDAEGVRRHGPARAAPLPMDELPWPAYDLVRLENYYYQLLGDRFALVEASRGCPYTCNFCNLSMFQRKYRKKSPEVFFREVDRLVEEHGCRSLYVFDLEFTVNRALALAFTEHLIARGYAKKLGFRWACQTRADSVDDELLKLMKQSGCDLIHFGVEAGNPEVLARTNKKIDHAALRTGLTAARRAGIKTAGFFIFGHPGEGEGEYRETLDFALELDPTYASFHPILPFPGSPLFENMYGKGPYWDDPIPLDLTYFTPAQEKMTARFVRKAYLAFYLRPRHLWSLVAHGDPALYRRQLRLFLSFLGA